MIGIPVKDNSENPEVDERFGRGQMFCIIDSEGKYKVIDNTAKEQASGAGGMAVKLLADENVDTVISPHVGPKATDAINALGIKVYQVGNAKTVKKALEMFKSGKLLPAESGKQGLKRV